MVMNNVSNTMNTFLQVVKARAEHLAAVEKEKAVQAQLRAEIPLSPIPDNLNGYVVPIQTHVGADPLPVAPAAQLAYAPEQYGYGPYSYGLVAYNMYTS